jgi:serine/threonine protein kinase
MDLMLLVDHPHIVKHYTWWKEKYVKRDIMDQNMVSYYLIMKFAEKGNLFDLFLSGSSQVSYQAQDYIRIIEEICLGLSYLHSKGLMHRDIKPHNIVIDNNGKIQLCDLELIKEVEKQTQTREVGTEGYLAPELYKGSRYDESVDMWSLGITIMQIYFRYSIDQLKFNRDQVLKDIKKIKNNEVLVYICDKCLQRDPKKRITSHGVLKFIDSLKKMYQIYVNPSTFYVFKEITENFQCLIVTELFNFNKYCKKICSNSIVDCFYYIDEKFQGIVAKSSKKEILAPIGKEILVKKLFLDREVRKLSNSKQDQFDSKRH